jgi:ABC-type phosphate transport system auxiliary subunit
MKPSFHFIGINDLKETIINLEKKARERKDLDSVPGLVEQIDRIFKKSLKELNAELENLRKGSNA